MRRFSKKPTECTIPAWACADEIKVSQLMGSEGCRGWRWMGDGEVESFCQECRYLAKEERKLT